MDEERIETLLGNGYKIVVERSHDPNFPTEVYVGIEKDGMWIQDLVIVRNAYKVINDKTAKVEPNPEAVEMLIYGDTYSEDYTDKVVVDIYKDEEED